MNTLDLKALAVVIGGFALPSITAMAYSQVSGQISRIPLVGGVLTGSGMTSDAARFVAGAGLASAIAYGASSMGLISGNNATVMAGIATALFAVGALSNSGVLPASITNMITPTAESIDRLEGYSGNYINGHSGGYLGYLGNLDEEVPTDNANEPMLYGVGAAQKVNIF